MKRREKDRREKKKGGDPNHMRETLVMQREEGNEKKRSYNQREKSGAWEKDSFSTKKIATQALLSVSDEPVGRGEQKGSSGLQGNTQLALSHNNKKEREKGGRRS